MHLHGNISSWSLEFLFLPMIFHHKSPRCPKLHHHQNVVRNLQHPKGVPLGQATYGAFSFKPAKGIDHPWLVVGPSLWKIWVRQLGWWQQPNINGKIQKMATIHHQPDKLIIFFEKNVRKTWPSAVWFSRVTMAPGSHLCLPPQVHLPRLYAASRASRSVERVNQLKSVVDPTIDTSGRVKSLHSALSHSRGSVSAWKLCLRVPSIRLVQDFAAPSTVSLQGG